VRGRSAALRRLFGVVPQEIALYEELSGLDNLLGMALTLVFGILSRSFAAVIPSTPWMDVLARISPNYCGQHAFFSLALAGAVRTIASGGAALQPTVARKVMDAFARLAQPSPGAERHLVGPLSGRERAVLGLLARGLSNKEIAERLFLAEGTVKNHVSTILQKIDARDRTQAALKARELGLLEE
jgi:DNA-binding CsgD family transcriptional regulator